MNPTVSAALTTQLTSFSDGVNAQLVAILPVAVPLAITISLVFFGWRIFRGLAQV